MRPSRTRTTRPKVRYPRVERSEPLALEAEDSHSWAVSYSDLLLVMLSFFVIFFSIEKSGEDNKQSALRSLAMSLGATPVDQADALSPSSEATARNATEGTPAAGLPAASSLQVASHRLKELGLDVSSDAEPGRLLILFPGNSYAPRGFNLPDELKAKLDRVIEVARPHLDSLQMTLIGHTDNTPVTALDNLLTDNHILGALRASKALDYMRSQGVPEEALFIGSEASTSRNTRSLSLRIEIRSEGPSEGPSKR